MNNYPSNSNKSLNVTLMLTERCNLNCKYCYEKDKATHDMTKEVAEQAVKFFMTDEYYSQAEELSIEFFGGEPFLMPSLIRYVIVRAKEMAKEYNPKWTDRLYFHTTTNLTQFKDIRARSLLYDFKELHISGSIDGTKEVHNKNRVYGNGKGSYDDAIKGFKFVSSTGRRTTTKGTINKDTLKFVADSMIHQIKLGADNPWANPIFEEKWTDEDAEVYYKQLCKVIDYIFENKLENSTPRIGKTRQPKDAQWCGSGSNMAAVDVYGNIYPCQRCVTEKHNIVLGNIWDGIDINKLIEWVEGMQKINNQRTAASPLCYAYCYGVNGKYEIHGEQSNMFEAECKALDYWNEKLRARNNGEI